MVIDLRSCGDTSFPELNNYNEFMTFNNIVNNTFFSDLYGLVTKAKQRA